MPFNGSGVFAYTTSGTPMVTGTTISSTVANNVLLESATGLSTCLTKDGQSTATARIQFALGIGVALTTDTTSGSTGGIYTAGGLGVAKAIFCGTNLFFGGTTATEIRLRRSNQTLVVALGDNSAFADLQCAGLNVTSVANNTGLAYGEYNPTLTSITNITGSTSGPAQYLRVGNTVIVVFYVTIQATGAGLATIRFSLPITSAFAALTNGSGTVSSSGSSGGGMFAVNATALMEYNYVATTTGSQIGHFGTFAYKVI